MALPRWAVQGIGEDLAADFQHHASSGDGHCFFQSIRTILASVGLDRSIDQLRRVVAQPVLKADDAIVNLTIQNWLELYRGALQEQDVHLLEEYRHMAPLAQAQWPLTPEDRRRLYDTMLTNQYWGEHHACRIVEEQTQMRFLIFCHDVAQPQLTWYHSTSFRPTHYCFLLLYHQHYMPVSFRGRFVFRWDEIPPAVQAFFSQAYRSPPRPVDPAAEVVKDAAEA